MKKRYHQLTTLVLFAGLLMGCDTLNSQIATDGPQSQAAIAQDLNLNAEQIAQLENAIGRDAEPGALWGVAAELQQTLTDEQKAELLNGLEERTVRERRRGPRVQARQHKRGQQMRQRTTQARQRRGAHHLDLTEDQREAMQPYREAIRELMQQRRAGDIEPEAFREQMETLREESRATFESNLTEEQKAKIEAANEKRTARVEERREQFSERRGADQAAREAALQLTEEQKTALEAHGAEQREAAEAIRTRILEEHATRASVREEMEALREAQKAAMEAILTPAQRETIMIHRALIQRAADSHRQAFQERRQDRMKHRRR